MHLRHPADDVVPTFVGGMKCHKLSQDILRAKREGGPYENRALSQKRDLSLFHIYFYYYNGVGWQRGGDSLDYQAYFETGTTLNMLCSFERGLLCGNHAKK